MFCLGSQTRFMSTKTCSHHVQVLQLNLKTWYPECCQIIFGARIYYYIHSILQHAPRNAGSCVANGGGHSFLFTSLSPKPVTKLPVQLIAMSCFKEGIDFFLVGHVIFSW